jgi:excisionase family DNA binding protein
MADQTILISLPINEFQSIIMDCVYNCLSSNKQESLTVVDPPVSTRDICTFLDITEPTLIRWRNKGKIPCLRVGRRVLYQKSAVIAALNNAKKGKS